MEIMQLSPADYASAFPDTISAFSGVPFSELNAAKVESVEYLAFADDSGRPRLGLILGRKADGLWRCPFSAPFGEVTSAGGSVSLARGVEMLSALKSWLGSAPLAFTPPPRFLLPANYGNILGPMLNAARSVVYNYNYHYDLTRFARFADHLEKNARKNYKRALAAQFGFTRCDIPRAYQVIKANRTRRGYYLAMTLEQVEATASVIPIDCFVLTLGQADVAAAVVYTVAPGVAHVVYWGDVDGFGEYRPMNILPYHLFSHYADLGYRIINIGPSSIDGEPSLGLCSFKQSLGCELTLIPSLTL